MNGSVSVWAWGWDGGKTDGRWWHDNGSLAFPFGKICKFLCGALIFDISVTFQGSIILSVRLYKYKTFYILRL